MLGIPTTSRPAYTRDYLEVLNAALAGPGTVDVENSTVHGAQPDSCWAPMTPMPVLVAALGPVMLQIAGEHADGTVLWMADERAIGDHVVPRITKAADDAGRPAPRDRRGHPGLPVRPLRSRRGQGAGQPHPRRSRSLTELSASLGTGDARDIGDLLRRR